MIGNKGEIELLKKKKNQERTKRCGFREILGLGRSRSDLLYSRGQVTVLMHKYTWNSWVNA